MAEKGEVFEKFCVFSTNKIEVSKSMAISPLTTTRLLHEAERITCDFDAIQAHLRHNKLSVGTIKPRFQSELLQRRPAFNNIHYGKYSSVQNGLWSHEKFQMFLLNEFLTNS